MKDILIILPTRNRPNNVKRFYDAWKKNTSGDSFVVLMGDTDDVNDYSYTGWIEERHDRMTPTEKMNFAAEKYSDGTRVIAFLADDVVIETKNFEKIILELFGESRYGIIYGENYIPFNYPDHPFITTELYKKMGWFSYPKLFHSFIDYVWDDIGKFLVSSKKGIYFKSDRISMRNIHPDYIKSVTYDDNYKWVYREEKTNADKVTYTEEWLKKDFIKLQKKSFMKVILSGYEGSKKILTASSFLVNKYLQGFDVKWLNYGAFDGKLYCGEYISLKDKQINGSSDWSQDISDYLKTLDDEFIIFALDDYLLSEPLNRELYESIFLLPDDVVEVNLCATSDPLDTSYSVTSQYTLWRREFLLEVLRRVKTPWEFEIHGSYYLNSLHKKNLYIPALRYADHSCLSNKWKGINLSGVSSEDLEYLRSKNYI